MKPNTVIHHRKNIAALLAIVSVIFSAQVWAVACNTIFSNAIQATASNGNINLSYHSIMTGGGATLQAKSITDNTSWVACSGSSCAASGNAATTSTVAFQTGTGTNGAINIAYQGTQNVAAGDYSTVTVGQQATINFTTSNGIYKTTAFTTNYQSIVQLQSGDYWINGDLTLAQATILKRVAASGTTRIWVNGNVSIGFQVSTQSFTSDQLLIYATGTITSANEANLTAFIYAVGNVSFNYNSIINGAVSGANFTATGNQVTVNYQSSAFSTANFAPFCSGTTAPAPVLLGSWHMDEGSWNGTAGEVIDSSGQGNNGRARIANGSSALPSTTSGSSAYSSGAQSTCRYGAFDGTGGSPLRTYNYVELSGFPTLPNGFTFAAWIRSSNSGAQHQRILVRDDNQDGWGLSLADGTGSPELRFFNRNVTNTGTVTGQGRDPSCGVFCVDTNPIISSNTWYYVAAVVDTTAATVTLYVYNTSGVSQAKVIAPYAGTWKDGTGTAAIGGETSASSEGQQTAFHFLGNIDEVNIYSGALSQTNIESLLTTVRTCPAPDHYEMDVASTSIACAGTDITVRACADSAVPCNQDNSVNGTVTLAATAGALNTTALAISAGTGTTKLKYPAAIDGALSTVTLSGETTTATNGRKCCTGSSTCSVANSCTTTFKTAGFIFSNSATGVAGNIPTEIAGTVDNSVYLRSLQTDKTTGACAARFTSPQIVPLAYQCRNPTTCVSGQTLTLNGASVQSNSNTASPIAYTNVSLSFDATGTAPIPLNYSDVGQIRLWANLVLAATTNDPAYTLTGTSNDFVVKPYTLAVSSVKTSGGVANSGGTGAAGTGAQFVSAGTNFQVQVEARNSAGARTPNFGNEITSENNITLNNLALVYPSGGTATPITLGASFSATTPAGTFVNNSVAWSQVGSFTLQPRLSDNDYLGAGDIAQVTTSPTIGRIFPDHYRVVTSPAPLVQNACAGNGFTYMGQPAIGVTYTLQAETTANAAVSNYGGNYGASSSLASPFYVAENNDSGTDLGSRFTLGTTPSWVAGQMLITSTVAQFARQISTVPDGPYTSLQLGVNVTDLFDSVSLQNKNMNATTTGACSGSSCSAFALGSPLNLRYGRLKLEDAFGPESVALPVNFQTEYWVGNHFSLNTNDSCTQIVRSAITYPNGTLTNDANRTVTLSGGTTQGIYGYSNLPTNSYISFNAGTAGQQFSAPTNSATGGFIVITDLTSYPWLRFDWNQDGNFSDTKLPDANFGFGSYRGNDRIIYWREKLQ